MHLYPDDLIILCRNFKEHHVLVTLRSACSQIQELSNSVANHRLLKSSVSKPALPLHWPQRNGPTLHSVTPVRNLRASGPLTLLPLPISLATKF